MNYRVRARICAVLAAMLATVTAGCAGEGSVAASGRQDADGAGGYAREYAQDEQTREEYTDPEPEAQLAADSARGGAYEPAPTQEPEPSPPPEQPPEAAPEPPAEQAQAYSPEPAFIRPPAHVRPPSPHRPTHPAITPPHGAHRPHRPEPTPTPAPERTFASENLIDMPPLSVANVQWFETGGTQRNNAIRLNPRGAEQFGGTLFNSVTYWLGAEAYEFRATLTPPPRDGSREVHLIYRIHGYFADGSNRPLHTSRVMTSNSAPNAVSIDVRNVRYLRLELEVRFVGDPAPGFPSHGFPGGYRGIENALVVR
ncbi:MAG: hypothetical protein FWD98_08585 [Defluviitaleaceae bacterium]|nr:hypothetical protein [Defluviitaleaceae bacterium]